MRQIFNWWDDLTFGWGALVWVVFCFTVFLAVRGILHFVEVYFPGMWAEIIRW